MLSFHPLTLADKPWIDKHVFRENSRSADFNFGNMFLWDEQYHQLVADCRGRLVVLACADRTPIYPFPIGSGELESVIEDMLCYARDNGFPFVIRGLETHHVDLLESLFPGKFRFTQDRDYADYLYSAGKLASLSGKKLHSKRNHCNRFEAEHRWEFRPLSGEDFPHCLRFLDRWAQTVENGSEYVAAERRAVLRAFENFNALDLIGGALYAEDTLIGFTLGEKISEDTFDVHFEKADASVNGAYSMVNREFVRMILTEYPGIQWINREDDMGLENLRRSKLSYHPDLLLEKFSAQWVD